MLKNFIEFEMRMKNLGILKGAMAYKVNVDGSKVFHNDHIQWVWEQFLKTKH